MKEDIYRSLCTKNKTLAIMPTFSCTARCRDCGSHRQSRRENRLSRAQIIESISQAGELDFVNIVFTGGEATLMWENLLKGIRFSSSIGLQTRLVSNGHWACSMDDARNCLEELIKNGLNEINFSTGDEHSRFIPVEFIINGIMAALEFEMTAHIMIEYKAIREIKKASILDNPLLLSLSHEKREKIKITESPWMPISPTRTGCYQKNDTIDVDNVALREGCPSVLQSYCIEADGRIAACCGLGISEIPELYVGMIRGKNYLKRAIEYAESDFLKIWLRYKGPEKILAWAAEKNSSIKWQGLYAHNCQTCQRLYKDADVAEVIRSNYQELISDVFQSLWFDVYYYPDRLVSMKNKN